MSGTASNVPQSTINNCESVLNKIGNLYCDRVLSDVTLRVGAQEYPAHRLILCASSDVFQVMLLKPEWSESCESVVVLHEAEECVTQFGPFLRYLYTGTVTLTHATVLPILALADKYNVQDLRVVCGVYMKQHVVSAAEHNLLLSWLQYCMASQHTAVATACLNHFKWNFEQVARTTDFLNCDGGLLTSVLAQHDLVVHDEMTLYTYVVSWLNHQESRLQVSAPDQHRAQRHCSDTPLRHCPITPLKHSADTLRHSADTTLRHGSVTPPYSTSLVDPLSAAFLSSQNKQLALQHMQPKLDFKIKEEAIGPETMHLCSDNKSTANCCSCLVDKSCNIGAPTPMECSNLCLCNVDDSDKDLSSGGARCRSRICITPLDTCRMRHQCYHQHCPYGTHHCSASARLSSSFLHYPHKNCRCNPHHPHRQPHHHSHHCPNSCCHCSGLNKNHYPCHDGHCRGPGAPDQDCESSRTYSEPPPLQLGTGKLYLRCSGRPEGNSTESGVDDVAHQMECLTYEVMSFVRFAMMTPRQLADLLLVPLTIHYKEFFVTRMAIGMAFHSGQWSRVREVVESGDEASRLLFTPRLYTAEQWSAGLTVDNLPALPPYHTRTLVFSTPASASELENESQLEWIVELYPKGVWFRKYLLIVWQGTVEVPEAILSSVRLSVTYNSASNTSVGDKASPSLSTNTASPRVRLAVLIYAYRDGVEFVSHVVTRRHIFSPDDNLLNMDDILPFNSLNDSKEAEQYLLPPCNSLKIHVVISPLSPPAYCPPSSP